MDEQRAFGAWSQSRRPGETRRACVFRTLERSGGGLSGAVADSVGKADENLRQFPRPIKTRFKSIFWMAM
ncbi:hypothetical protein [Marinicauda salina]|uniref:hypothetical protein n=1 Tax=Marinicauda salina TaxID=2135793 RepID=UPI0011B24E79|nr:hypothetical protein [Marinicauda salina]